MARALSLLWSLDDDNSSKTVAAVDPKSSRNACKNKILP
jgi:hypothetical protein